MNNQMIMKIKQMFPNANLDEAIRTATQAVEGKSPNEAPNILKSLGVTSQGINNIFNKYGNTMQAKALLGMLGTNPNQLKDQALSMLGNNGNSNFNVTNNSVNANTNKSNINSRYPRLK